MPETKKEAPRRIERNREVLLVQTVADLGEEMMGSDGESSAIMLTLSVFAKARRPRGATWQVFLGSPRRHFMGLTLWVGFSRNVPDTIVDQICTLFGAMGGQTSREMGHAARHDMVPCIYYGDDGFELLVPADDDTPDEAFDVFLEHAERKARVRRCIW